MIRAPRRFLVHRQRTYVENGRNTVENQSKVPGEPFWSLSVLFDPGRIRQAEWTRSELPDTAPAYVHNEGSRRLQFSGLNHTTFGNTGKIISA